MMFLQAFRDKEYLHKLWVLALPLILQQFINYSVNLMDTLMVGSFGDAALAAVSLSTQFYTLYYVFISGTVSGGNVLLAQFWGKKDSKSIHRVMGIQLAFTTFFGLVFFLATQFAPETVLRFYSKDESVIQNGAVYLRILGFMFLIYPVGQVYSGAMRCTENTHDPMRISLITLLLNVSLNYVLIFGKLGLPALGLQGAALATVTARVIEVFIYLFRTYLCRLPSAAQPRELVAFPPHLVGLLVRKSAPMVLNDFLWGLGTNIYSSIYAGISTASIAAYSAASPVENIALSFFYGVGDASAVITGNLLGAEEFEKARRYARYTLTLTLCAAAGIGLLMIGLRAPVLTLYSLSEEAKAHAMKLLVIMGITLTVRALTYTMIMGILRPGGEALYCMVGETAAQWIFGIQCAWLLANQAHLPVYWVYVGALAEEFVKLPIFYFRVRSDKWVRCLVD